MERVEAKMTTRLSEIERRVNAASPAPWWTSPKMNYVTAKGWGWLVQLAGANKEFIAHARTDVPYLLSLCKSLEAEVKALREMEVYTPKADAIAKEREGLG
jgi:hypothetical protein